MTLWEELGLMLREMSPWTAILLIGGILLIIIDAFDTGFDITGAGGLLAIVAGIAIRMVQGGTVLMLTVMILFVIVVVFVSVYFIFRSAEKGWLSRTALFDKTPAVPYDKTEGTPDYTELLGKTGETLTAMRPVGKIRVEERLFDASCESSFIEQGRVVELVEVDGYRIVVRENL